MAEGSPDDPQLRTAIDEASRWFVRLQAPDSSPNMKDEWQRWLGASPHNHSAWARVQAVQQLFADVPGAIGLPTLTLAGRKRRRALQLMVAGGFTATLAWWMAESQTGAGWTADLATPKGLIKPVTLPDGSLVVLDTDSAVDVAFDIHERRLILERGEIYIKTAVDPAAARRPFIVQTRHGQVRALGTEFVVRVGSQASKVRVNQHAVLVTPARQPGVTVQVNAGHRAMFSTQGVERSEAFSGKEFASWRNGSLIVLDLPMEQLVRKLKAYRPGFLGMDPALSGIKVSGVFPLLPTDRALSALEITYPVKVRHFTRYWTWIEPRR